MFKIKVGDFNLLDSGCVITMKDADIHFKINDLEYVFRFVNNEEGKARIQIVSNNGKRMEVELQNFNDPIGVGNVNPMPMGTFEGNPVFLLFRISQLKDGGKTMYYTWLSRSVESIKEENHD